MTDDLRTHLTAYTAALSTARPDLAQELTALLAGPLRDPIEIEEWQVTCGACPLVIEGRDAHTGRPLYFRLRHGGWRVCWDDRDPRDNDWEIASGTAPGDIDGYATTEQVRAMLAPHGITLGEQA